MDHDESIWFDSRGGHFRIGSRPSSVRKLHRELHQPVTSSRPNPPNVPAGVLPVGGQRRQNTPHSRRGGNFEVSGSIVLKQARSRGYGVPLSGV